MSGIKSDEYKPTHKQVVQRIAKWYKSRHQSCIVMAELVAAIREIPDVIVWTSGARSTLIECKASRADFLSDKDKYFRRQEKYGVGDRRYYAAPMGIIQPEDLPAGWGLIELTKRQIIEVVPPTAKTADKRNECIMLMSALRRLEISTAVYVVHDNGETNQEGGE